MPLAALVLTLFAALLHAFWNLLAKNAHDSAAFMWWGVTIGSIWYALVVATQTSLDLPRDIWIPYVASIVAEIAYLIAITRGYANGDLSQVYPIARGSPPLLIAIWSAVLFAERLPLFGYFGIGLVIIGVYLSSLPTLKDFWRPLQAISHRPAQWGLAAAVCVSAYTVLDKVLVGQSTPLVYNAWVYMGLAVGYAPIAWAPVNRASTCREWRSNWKWILIGSVATIGSYLLALTAMSMTLASYVGAVRATSVVIGAIFGWILLKERLGWVRVVAAALMSTGLIVLALA